MPNLGAFHPQVVHFVVALLFVGLGMRIVALVAGKRWGLGFTNYAAATLLILGTLAAVAAVKTGDDAHGPVERIPGVRDAVVEHEEYGEKARNIFLGVAFLELLALGLARRERMLKYARYTLVGSALLGGFGGFYLYEAAEHGGELVYSYGGGPGLRTGDPEDVERMLVAALFNQSRIDRGQKRHADAAALVSEMARRNPGDAAIQLLRVESLVIDVRDHAAALALLDSIKVPDDDARLRPRHATLKADAYLALGKPDSARVALAPVVAAFPANTRLKAKLDSIR